MITSFMVGTFQRFPEISVGWHRSTFPHIVTVVYLFIQYLLYVALGSGVAADILIAASLCIALALSRSRTGVNKYGHLFCLVLFVPPRCTSQHRAQD
jgi:hypothetical protein